MRASSSASVSLPSSLNSAARRIQSMSAPAQKVSPSPRTNTTRTWSAPFSVSNVSIKPAIIISSKALRFSARLRVTVATPSGDTSSKTGSSAAIVLSQYADERLRPFGLGRLEQFERLHAGEEVLEILRRLGRFDEDRRELLFV